VIYENRKYEYDLMIKEEVKKVDILNTIKNNSRDIITNSLTK